MWHTGDMTGESNKIYLQRLLLCARTPHNNYEIFLKEFLKQLLFDEDEGKMQKISLPGTNRNIF